MRKRVVKYAMMAEVSHTIILLPISHHVIDSQIFEAELAEKTTENIFNFTSKTHTNLIKHDQWYVLH